MSEAADGSTTSPISAEDVERLRRARPEARLVLVVYHRDGAEVAALRPGVPITLGRDAPADVTIADASLSRRHARVTQEGELIVVEDCGSTNGTWVRGERITRATVASGEEIAFGAVTGAVRLLDASEAPPGAVESHDAITAALDRELVRARFFGRKVALLMASSAGPPAGSLSALCPRLQAAIRPVDRIGAYSGDAAEVLLPEMDADAALELGRRLAKDGVRAGIAVFPDAATSAERMIAASRSALQAATREAPVQLAAAEGRAVPLAREARGEGGGDGPVAASAAMRELLDTVDRVARAVIPVLLLGETGVGKEVVSRAIHDGGPRRERPLLFVNCAAIPSQLVESTLFGHEKGAFTGAAQQQAGVFEAAQGGTVLLDEIGELPAAAQAALLRVLETKRLTRVGGTREIQVDVRVIAATHRDLEAMSEQGAFRTDLLFRLNALTLTVPPLRERREDIAPLARRFLEAAGQANGRAGLGIDDDALELLLAHRWPGNVRELRNAIERAVVIARGDAIGVEDLPERIRAAGDAPPPAPSAPAAAPPAASEPAQATFRDAVQGYESQLIVDALRACSWSQTAAARRLEMPLRTLIHKMKTYGIQKLGFDRPR